MTDSFKLFINAIDRSRVKLDFEKTEIFNTSSVRFSDVSKQTRLKIFVLMVRAMINLAVLSTSEVMATSACIFRK